MNLIQHYVNGKSFAGSSKRRGKVFDPATGSQASEVSLGTKKDLATRSSALGHTLRRQTRTVFNFKQ